MVFDLIIGFLYVSKLFDANMALIVMIVGLAYTYLGAKITSWGVKKRRRTNVTRVSLLSYHLGEGSTNECSHVAT